MAQAPSPWTVVRYPKDEPFDVGLVTTTAPAGCGKCDSPSPTGLVKVKRDDQYTTLEFVIGGLPSKPGKYYLYTIDGNGRAKRLDTLGTKYQTTRQLPPDEYETFMLIVSADANLRALPPRNKILLYSVVPRGLTAVPH